MGYSALLVVGISADQIIEEKNVTSSYTKYNEHTGEPYEVYVEESKYILNGKEYDIDELQDVLNEYDLEPYPTQHDDWNLEDMVIGKEVSSNDGGQCAEIAIKIGGTEWNEIQSGLKSLGAKSDISIFTIQEYS